jgi:hypothetical protein
MPLSALAAGWSLKEKPTGVKPAGQYPEFRRSFLGFHERRKMQHVIRQ